MDESNFILQNFESEYFYGQDFQVSLPTRLPKMTKEEVIIGSSNYNPIPYVVAHYKFTHGTHSDGVTRFFYKFDGLEIK